MCHFASGKWTQGTAEWWPSRFGRFIPRGKLREQFNKELRGSQSISGCFEDRQTHFSSYGNRKSIYRTPSPLPIHYTVLSTCLPYKCQMIGPDVCCRKHSATTWTAEFSASKRPECFNVSFYADYFKAHASNRRLKSNYFTHFPCLRCTTQTRLRNLAQIQCARCD
jgi:hypothetical protein